VLRHTGVIKKGVFWDVFIARSINIGSQLSRTVHQHVITTESQTSHREVLIIVTYCAPTDVCNIVTNCASTDVCIIVTSCASAVFETLSRTVRHDVLTTNSHEMCFNGVCSKVTKFTSWCAHNWQELYISRSLQKSRTVHHDVLTTSSHELCMNRYLDLLQSLTLHLICSHLSAVIFGISNNYAIWVQHSSVMWRRVVW
jgi:hypothetical protein